MAEPIHVSTKDAERRIHMADVWARYRGNHPDSLDFDIGVNDNVTVNDLATVVDTGVDFLLGSGQGEVEIGVLKQRVRRGKVTETHDEATAWIDDVMLANRKSTWLRKWGTSGAIVGQSFVKIVPATVGGVRGADANFDPKGMHRIVLLDPETVVVQTDDNDIDLITGYAIDENVYGNGQVVGRRREQHTRNADGTTWTVEWLVTNQPLDLAVSNGTTVQWMPDPARPKPAIWPHPFPAIVDSQNLPAPHQVWGRSDLTPDILHLQESINRVASNETRTLRMFAHPLPYGVVGEKGDPSAAANAGVIDASIGAMRWYAHGTEIRTLPVRHEGLEAAAKFRDSLTDKLFEVARTPRIAAGKVEDVGALSGVAMLILYRPLVAKTQTKRDTYGDALRELCLRLLILAEFSTSEHPLDVVLTWPDALPRDMQSEVAIARELRELGVSLRTVLERIGINYDQEKPRIDEENGDPLADAHGLLAQVEELTARLAIAEGDTAAASNPVGNGVQDDTTGA